MATQSCTGVSSNVSSQFYEMAQEHGVPVLVYILNRPEDWEYALKLEGITAIMTDSPSALAEYLSDKKL